MTCDGGSQQEGGALGERGRVSVASAEKLSQGASDNGDLQGSSLGVLPGTTGLLLSWLA